MRIASLVPSLTELLFSLDLDDHIVARSGFCVHPRDRVKKVPKVGGTKDVDVDALLATNPTHLIVNIDENRRELAKTVANRIPEIVVTHPLVPADNIDLYREFGRLFDRRAEAVALETQFRSADAALASAVDPHKPTLNVLYLIWKEPWFTISRSTYISAMLAKAGLISLPDEAPVRYPVVRDDDPVWRRADVILLSSEPYAFRQRHVEELAAQLVVNKPILLVDGELLSWYGSRAIQGLGYAGQLRAQIESALNAAG